MPQSRGSTCCSSDPNSSACCCYFDVKLHGFLLPTLLFVLGGASKSGCYGRSFGELLWCVESTACCQVQQRAWYPSRAVCSVNVCFLCRFGCQTRGARSLTLLGLGNPLTVRPGIGLTTLRCWRLGVLVLLKLATLCTSICILDAPSLSSLSQTPVVP